MPPKYSFQIKLKGQWTDYYAEENAILTRAYLSGNKKVNYTLRGNSYEYDFSQMKQKNISTGKERSIRPPYGMKPPQKPIVKPGPTMMAIVPPGARPGDRIMVPHPTTPGVSLQVTVPPGAHPGATLMVPVPPVQAPANPFPPASPYGAVPPPMPPQHTGQVVVPQQAPHHTGQVVVPQQQAPQQPPVIPQQQYQQPPVVPQQPSPSAPPQQQKQGGGYGTAAAVGGAAVGVGAVGAAGYYAHQQGHMQPAQQQVQTAAGNAQGGAMNTAQTTDGGDVQPIVDDAAVMPDDIGDELQAFGGDNGSFMMNFIDN